MTAIKRALWIIVWMSLFCPLETASALPPKIDIIIDAGHGGVDSGTTYGNVLEKEINLQIAKILYQELEKGGYGVLLNRTGDYALSDENRWLNNPSRHLRDLAQRKHLALTIPPQVMISLHTNWSSEASKRGPLVLYQKSNQSFMLADVIQHAMNQYYGTEEEPIAGKTYYLLKHQACPTLIVEMGFISNRQDRLLLTNPKSQQEIAQSIKAGIDEYFFLVGSNLNKTTPVGRRER